MFPAWPVTDAAIRDIFQTMLADGSWGRYHGPHCDRLREALAEFHSVDHVHLCSSGTCAIELALRAVGVEPGDEVILAAYDYKANFANVLTLGAVPVLIDTLPGLPVPDVGQLAEAVSDRTGAIICSHLHGSLAPVSRIRKFADKHHLPVIEDACQAAGGRIGETTVGALGDLGILSFGGSKLMTAGRGGAVLTGNPRFAQRVRLFTQRGNDAYPMSEMQAAVLLPQLKQLPERTHIRQQNVQQLISELNPRGMITPALNPLPDDGANTPAYYKVAFTLNGDDALRDRIAATLRNNGVAIDPAFPALHRIHSRSRFRAVGSLPNATRLHDSLLTLHHPILLQDKASVSRVATTINAVCSDASSAG